MQSVFLFLVIDWRLQLQLRARVLFLAQLQLVSFVELFFNAATVVRAVVELFFND